MLDFSKLKKENNFDKIIKPEEIFMSLPNKADKYQYPRNVQAEIWSKWFESRDEKDTIIKMNTGSGKTIVGLLILESSRRENKKPTVYILPDKYLVDQVVQEAQGLGLDITVSPDDIDFICGNKILVTNIYTLVNGKTKFGMRENEENIPIHTLLIDDVHACTNIIEEQFTIKISKTNILYSKIYAVFESALKKQYRNKIIELNNNQPIELLVPYWEWHNKNSEVYDILLKENDDQSIKFSLPLIASNFELCNCVITDKIIEISPKSIDLNEIRGISEAKKRIFMSATIMNISSLACQFGIQNVKVITPKFANDIGERFILMPELLNSKITPEEIKTEIKALSQNHNVLVITPSKFRADSFWGDVRDDYMDTYNIYDCTKKLKEGHVGLIITSNRYDGIDLPNSACEVLVIDGLPNMKNEFDKIEQQMLKNSSRILNKKIQLIEQGMGRAVRSSTDYCVIVLMGKGVITTLFAENYITTMNKATQEQIKLSQDLGEQLRGKSAKEVFESSEVCLKRNEDWKKVSKEILLNADYNENIADFLVDKALNETYKIAKCDYEKAVEYLDKFIKDNSNLDKEIQGWLKFQLAEYYDFLDKAKSQEILKSANSLNNRILKPIEGIQYQKNQKKLHEQAQNIYDYFNAKKINNNSFILEVKELLNNLSFSQEIDANDFEEAFCTIGKLIGIESVRPEAEGTGDPDNLWWISSEEALVIECKNRVMPKNDICKSDCKQLNQSLEWFEKTYPKINAVGILIHPSNKFESGCIPKENVRIINIDMLNNLKNKVECFIEQLLSDKNYLDKDKIKELIIVNDLKQEKIVDTYTIKYKLL